MSTTYSADEWAALDAKPEGIPMERRDGSFIVLTQADRAVTELRRAVTVSPVAVKDEEPEYGPGYTASEAAKATARIRAAGSRAVVTATPFDLPAREAEEVFDSLSSRGPLPWIVPGLVFEGGVTLISGPPKKGKSTLVAQLSHAHLKGQPFLSREVARGPVLLLSEEGEYPFAYRWQRPGESSLPILRASFDPTFEVVFYADVASQQVGWGDVLTGVSAWVVDQRQRFPDMLPLVIIDTLAVWAGVEEENSTSETTTAVASVTSLAQSAKCGVILVHHTRKGGGQGGEGIRGSSAIYATADVSIEFRAPSEDSDNRRLAITGRVVLPSTIPLEFDRSSLTYSHGVDEVIDALPQLREWLAKLPSVDVAPEGIPASTAMEFWNLRSRNATAARLDRLVEKGLAVELEPRKVGRHVTRFWLPLREPTRDS